MNNDRFLYRVAIRQEDGSFRVCDVGNLWYRADKIIVEYSYIADEKNIKIGKTFIDGVNAILLQCTGLKDKNNKLIYAGDVLRHDFYGGGYCIRSVVRYEGGFFFCDDKDNLRHKAIHFALRGMMTQEVAKGFEVIGNVHEFEVVK